MAIKMTLHSATKDYSEYEDDFKEAAESLATQPPTAVLITEPFKDPTEARRFVSLGRAWAADHGLRFARKPIRDTDPAVVAFRIYVPRADRPKDNS